MSIVPGYRIAFLCIIFLCFQNILKAQEVGLQIAPGLINYGGDLQSKVYTFKQADLSLCIGAQIRVNKFVLRGALMHGKIKGDDLTNTGYKFRNLSFASNIDEINLCLQYDFLAMDEYRKFTPYIFVGIGYFHFNPYTSYNSQKVYLRPLSTEGEGLSNSKKGFYQLTQFENPLGIGMRYRLSDHIQLGVEFNSRLLYTDYIDDVSKKYADETLLFKERGQFAVDVAFRGDEIDPSLTFPSKQNRGNPKQKDNYYTTVFTLTYIFPGRSIFSGGNGGKEGRLLNCPKNIR